MHFVVIGWDGDDADALARRMDAREAHLARSDQFRKSGNMLMGIALLNSRSEMCGSVMLVDFPSRQDVENWLKDDPNTTGGVWKKIEIHEGIVGPQYLKLLQNTPSMGLDNGSLTARAKT